jgi:predicted amidophosphoribosyltransferase
MILGIIAVFVPIYKPVEKLVVLICPKCQARIPVCSKFCPECGDDLRHQSFQNKGKKAAL